MNDVKYLNLCNSIYSHIQSKDVREYYINEIKDKMTPDQLIFIIKYGYYSIEDKFDYIKELRSLINKSDISDMLKDTFDEYEIIEKDYYINDDVMYSGKFYFELHENETLSFMDETFYGRTFNEFAESIILFKQENRNFTDECTTFGCVDKVHMNKSYRDFIRYDFHNINGIYTITDGSVINNNRHAFEFYMPYPKAYMYPYKNGDKLVYKTPLMLYSIYGKLYTEIDGNGTYYAFIECDDGISETRDVDISDMFSVFEGYHSIDWITKVSEDEING